MKKNVNQLDELQEQKLLQIEKNGAWFAFWGMFAAIMVQIFLGAGQADMMKTIAGEWIVFMCLAVYMGVACIKAGIWDRRMKPNRKTNAVVSVVSGLFLGGLFFVVTYVRYGKLLGSIATGAVICLLIACVLFAALSGASAVYKKRVAKLEDEGEDSET